MPQTLRDFSRPHYRDPRWLETNWFSAYSHESDIRFHIWVGFRTNLDVAFTKVYAYKGIAESVVDMAFHDCQYHVPIGTSRLSHYNLASGVSVKAGSAPANYDVGYRSRCGRMTMELTYRSLMRPVSLDDSRIEHIDLALPAFHARAERSSTYGRVGLEGTGHLDQTMHVTGEVILDGQRHVVDCVSNRDHSWSPRAEWGHAPGSFEMAHFGEELTFLAHTGVDDNGNQGVSNAYLHFAGEVRRVVNAKISRVSAGRRLHETTYSIVDDQERSFTITASERSSAEFIDGGNLYMMMTLLDAEWEGRRGYAESLRHADILALQRPRTS